MIAFLELPSQSNLLRTISSTGGIVIDKNILNHQDKWLFLLFINKISVIEIAYEFKIFKT